MIEWGGYHAPPRGTSQTGGWPGPVFLGKAMVPLEFSSVCRHSVASRSTKSGRCGAYLRLTVVEKICPNKGMASTRPIRSERKPGRISSTAAKIRAGPSRMTVRPPCGWALSCWSVSRLALPSSKKPQAVVTKPKSRVRPRPIVATSRKKTASSAASQARTIHLRIKPSLTITSTSAKPSSRVAKCTPATI